MVGIYKITSPSGKVYIGQSWNISKRWISYQNYRCKSQYILYSSFRKYKVSNHKFEIIHILPFDVSQKDMDTYEILYWNLYKSVGISMMNIRVPGLGGKGSKHKPETIELMRQKQRENWQNPNRDNNHYTIKFSQFSLSGQFIKSWESIKEAADFYNVTSGCIANCIRDKNREKAIGYIWKKI